MIPDVEFLYTTILPQGLKPDLLHSWFSARLKSRPVTKQKQILRSAYPNFVGAPSCSAQDDTESRWMSSSKVS